jgi:hypothetical protein
MRAVKVVPVVNSAAEEGKGQKRLERTKTTGALSPGRPSHSM